MSFSSAFHQTNSHCFATSCLVSSLFQLVMSQVNKNTAELVPYLEHVKISYFKLSAAASRTPSAHRELPTSFCFRLLGVNAACAHGCTNLITDHGVTVLIISPSLENADRSVL